MEAQHFEIPSNVNSPVATANFHSARTPGHFLLYGMSLFTHFVHQKPFSCTNCRFSPGLYTTGLPPVQNTGSTLRLSEVFLIRHMRNKIALPHTFSSSSISWGKPQPATQSSLHHIPIFLMCYIRSKIVLPRTFCSSSDTSGRKTPSQTLCSPYVSHQEMGKAK